MSPDDNDVLRDGGPAVLSPARDLLPVRPEEPAAEHRPKEWGTAQIEKVIAELVKPLTDNSTPTAAAEALRQGRARFKETGAATVQTARVALIHEIENRTRLRSSETKKLAKQHWPELAEPPRGRGTTSGQGQVLLFEEVDAWPESVNGPELLAELKAVIQKYVILTPDEAIAVALWIVHTYLLAAIDISPRLAISSPLERCGKSRLLAVVEELAYRALSAINISAAALFRTIDRFNPTIVVDEFDNVRVQDLNKADLLGIFNSGWFRKLARTVRCVGEDSEPRAFSTWVAATFAFIGKIPRTLDDRSVVIRLRRKKKSESVSRMKVDLLHREFAPLRARLVRWTNDHLAAVREAVPQCPDALDDRAADNWSVLLAIADEAGGTWPEQARAAAVKLSGSRELDDESHKTMLLADLAALFKSRSTDRILTRDLVEALNRMADRPWPDYRRGKGISDRNVAELLKPLGITSGSIRMPKGKTPKGYLKAKFEDAFERYLVAETPQRHKA